MENFNQHTYFALLVFEQKASEELTQLRQKLGKQFSFVFHLASYTKKIGRTINQIFGKY
jgi:hypothetical protein